jgi:hypothetical protein
MQEFNHLWEDWTFKTIHCNTNVLQDTCKLKNPHTSHIIITNVISQKTSKATNCKSGNHKLEVVSIIIRLHKKPTNTSCQNLSKRYSNTYIKKLHNWWLQTNQTPTPYKGWSSCHYLYTYAYGILWRVKNLWEKKLTTKPKLLMSLLRNLNLQTNKKLKQYSSSMLPKICTMAIFANMKCFGKEQKKLCWLHECSKVVQKI